MLEIGKIYEAKKEFLCYFMDGYKIEQNKIFVVNDKIQKTLYLSPSEKILILKIGTYDRDPLYTFHQFLILRTGRIAVTWNYARNVKFRKLLKKW